MPTKPRKKLAAVPKWYTSQEMHHYLICENYSPLIADALCLDYAINLQKAFAKGFEIGQRIEAPRRKK